MWKASSQTNGKTSSTASLLCSCSLLSYLLSYRYTRAAMGLHMLSIQIARCRRARIPSLWRVYEATVEVVHRGGGASDDRLRPGTQICHGRPARVCCAARSVLRADGYHRLATAARACTAAEGFAAVESVFGRDR